MWRTRSTLRLISFPSMTLRALFGPRFERPTSPALSEAATEASALDFGLGEGAPEKIITRAQLKTSIGNYEKVCSRDMLMNIYQQGS
jgi:hypothetical protein